MPPQCFSGAPHWRAPSFIAALVATAALAGPAGAQPAAPLPTRGDTLLVALPDAVSRALAVGDEVRLVDAQEDATGAQLTVARATVLPQLRFNGGYTQVLENARATIVGSVFGQSYTYLGNVNLSLPLFQGGRAVAGIQAARRTQASSRFTIAETRAQVTVDVQRAYINALASDGLVAIQERNLAVSDQRVTQTEQLERAGRAARYDVLRIRVQRTNLEPLLIQARNDRDNAYLELRRLLNLPTAQPLRLTTTLPTDTAAVLAVLDRVGADTVLGDRGLLRASEELSRARAAAVRVARADYLPTVTFSFTNGYLALPSTAGFPFRFGETSSAFCPDGSAATRVCQNNGFFADRSVALQVSWPFFDGLRTKGNVDLAQANAHVAEVQLAQTRERVQVEVAQARANARRASALFQSQRANVAQAEEAFRLSELRLDRGLGTQLEVSDAQVALLTAQTNALRATYDVYLAAAELDRSLGRPIPLAGQNP